MTVGRRLVAIHKDAVIDAAARFIAYPRSDRQVEMSKPDVPQGVPPYTHALRVTFTFDAETITLAGVQRVAMRVPAPTSVPPDDRHAGYWLAVENAAVG